MFETLRKLAYSIVLYAGLSGTASAQDFPKGGVRLDYSSFGERGSASSGFGAGGNLSLDESVNLDVFYRRSVLNNLKNAEFNNGLAEFRVFDFAVGGGMMGVDGERFDWAGHVGYHPDFAVESDVVSFRSGLDFVVGAGGVRERGLTEINKVGRVINVSELDFYSALVGFDFDFAVRPVYCLELILGGYGEAFAVVSPRQRSVYGDFFGDVVEFTDPGISFSLSDARAGGYGEVDLQLFKLPLSVNGVSSLDASCFYRESWDWIHNDVAYSVLNYLNMDIVDGLNSNAFPVRNARSAGFKFLYKYSDDVFLNGAFDALFVENSTTLESFADRNGVSLGGSVFGRYARFFGGVSGRYHLNNSNLEEFIGEMPDFSVLGNAGVYLADNDFVNAVLRVDAGVNSLTNPVTGAPQDGFVGAFGLEIFFGGSGNRLRDDFFVVSNPLRREYAVRNNGVSFFKDENALNGLDLNAIMTRLPGAVRSIIRSHPEILNSGINQPQNNLSSPENSNNASNIADSNGLLYNAIDINAVVNILQSNNLLSYFDSDTRQLISQIPDLNVIVDIIQLSADVSDAGINGLLQSDGFVFVQGYDFNNVYLSGLRRSESGFTALNLDSKIDFADYASRLFDNGRLNAGVVGELSSSAFERLRVYENISDLARESDLEKFTILLNKNGERVPIFQSSSDRVRFLRRAATGMNRRFLLGE